MKTTFVRLSEGLIGLYLLLLPDIGIASPLQEGVSPTLTPRPFKVDALDNSKIDLCGTWKFNLSSPIGRVCGVV